MSDILDVLKTRRSCKCYKDTLISDEQLNKILEAGLYAPSGMNRQCTISLVITDKNDIDTLRRLNIGAATRVYSDPFYNAPMIVVVFADRNVSTHVEDGSLVMGNMMNEAHSIGVDSCWIHRAKETFETKEGREIARKYGVPDEYIGIGNCLLGFRDCEINQDKPRKVNRIIK